MSDVDIICEWTGAAFVPRGNSHMAKAHDTFGEGEIVSLRVQNERSQNSHNHYFAAIHDLWVTLPERLSEMPYALNSETLRKHALIVNGFADCETIDAGTKAAAERIAAYVGGLARRVHGYAIVKVEGCVVRCWTPHSQSMKAMGKDTFQRSKTAVLEWIEGEIEARAA